MMNRRVIIGLLLTWICFFVRAQQLVEVGVGYSSTSVNTTVFRANSVTSKGDMQFISYYDPEGWLVLGKRYLGESRFETLRSPYRGNCQDAHNVISIGIDGKGYLHVAFDHHNARLHYCKSVAPYSLQLDTLQAMVGRDEARVTYPEFYTLKNGDLLFACRVGKSGQGNLVLNRYDIKEERWQRLHDNLIDGEGVRNAYWQMCVDAKGQIHISWVWRETPAVETNHDLCYAISKDGGITWQKSTGEIYDLPIRSANAEYAFRIPPGSELMNQTSMDADENGNPFIASYWKASDDSCPQFRFIYRDKDSWQATQVGHRKTDFSLSGHGTKMVPISRPRIAVGHHGGKPIVCYIFRDEERGSRVSMAFTNNISGKDWRIYDLTDFPVGAWEPSFDTNLWTQQQQLHLFVQHTSQGDGEKVKPIESQPVYLLEVSSSLLALSQTPLEISIWLDGAPNSNGLTGQETESKPGHIGNVSQAVLYVYPAPHPNGLAVLACPGGGYARLMMNRENHQLAAQWFHALGITYMALKYRLPNGHADVPLADVRQAFRLVYEHADRWGVCKGGIGIMGSSAGGHLAASYTAQEVGTDLCPAFQILFYPVISMNSELAHLASRKNLLGEQPSEETKVYYSPDLQVQRKTPPTFIALSADDPVVSPLNSLRYYEALQRQGVPATLHIYPSGGHGWGFRNGTRYETLWKNELANWLHDKRNTTIQNP